MDLLCPRRLAAALVAALALLVPARPARAAVDAPLRLETDGTFQRLFLALTAADARALATPELDVRWTMSNDWSTPTTVVRGADQVTFQNDEQTDSLTVSLRCPWAHLFGPGPADRDRPLFERLSSALELRLTEHWGGWTDGPIEAWHGLVGATNFQRQLHPRDQVNVVLRDDRTGTGLDVHGSRLAVGDLVLRTQYLVAESGSSFSTSTPERARWGASVRLDLKAPLGSPEQLGGSGGFDAGLTLLGSGELTPWLTGHLLLGLAVWSGLGVHAPLQPRTWHPTAELSLVAHLGDWALVFEDRVTGPVFEDGWTRVEQDGNLGAISSGWFGAFKPQNQLSGGLRWRAFTLLFSEDWTPGSNPYNSAGWYYDSNTPDVTLGLAYTTALP